MVYIADVLVTLEVTSENAPGACETCDVQCGDISGNGAVDESDRTLLRAHFDGSQPIDHVCQHWAAMVAWDPTDRPANRPLEQRDFDRLEAYLDGESVEMSCPSGMLEEE